MLCHIVMQNRYMPTFSPLNYEHEQSVALAKTRILDRDPTHLVPKSARKGISTAEQLISATMR